MKIRNATYIDLDEILEIYARARSFMRDHGNPTQWGDTEPPIEWLDVDIERKELYVCADGDEVKNGEKISMKRLSKRWNMI